MPGSKFAIASENATLVGIGQHLYVPDNPRLYAMPRKRRPSPPAPGSIPPRNIAPKPDPNHPQTDNSSDKTIIPTPSSSRQSTAGSDIEANSCGVPLCTIPNCRLPTHLNYGRQRKLKLLQSSARSSKSSPDDISEGNLDLVFERGMEGQFKLPIADAGDGDFQNLFVQFFKYHFDRLVLIYRPQRRDPAMKQNCYRLALQNPVYCLTLIAQAHMANIKDITTNLDPALDLLTDKIYSTLLQLTREKVESFELDDIDVLLLAIVALCEYDLKLYRYDALRSHHIGMTALVSKKGGVHNLGLSLPYVLRMDRFLAVRANQLPQFSSLDQPISDLIMRSSSETLRYGSSFFRGSTSLSDNVVSLCSDAAQLLDLVYELKITFDPTETRKAFSPKLEYFHFLRENIDVRHAILNQQLITTDTNVNKDLLALTAMKIVVYYIATANYLPIVTDLLAARLWNMLIKSPSGSSYSPSKTSTFEHGAGDPPSMPTIDLTDWTEDMPMLLWLLFACALPGSRETSLSFTAHLASSSTSSGTQRRNVSESRTSETSSISTTSSRPRSGQAIVSPSSPRRHRYLPSFILHVAEHLIGERPVLGTMDWDQEVVRVLESFLWIGERLSPELRRITRRVHDNVLARAEDDV